MSPAGTIDGPRFAAERGIVSGEIGIEHLPRLAELGCEAATLRYGVRGGETAEGRATLAVEVTGQLRLVCQRCLDPLDFPVDVSSMLELAATQAGIDDVDDEIDRVLATNAMDVATLVEDETILALPMIPTHRRCETAVPEAGLSRASPFAALAGLGKGGSAPRGRSRKTNS